MGEPLKYRNIDAVAGIPLLTPQVTPEEFAAEWPGIFHFTGDGYYVKRNFPERYGLFFKKEKICFVPLYCYGALCRNLQKNANSSFPSVSSPPYEWSRQEGRTSQGV